MILVLFTLSLNIAKGQQYPVYSQYIFNPLVINPAVAGSHVQVSATAMHRNQWVNFEGAPKTLNFSAHTSLLKNKIGVGLMVSDDKIGSYSNQSVFGSYAYIIRSPLGTFSMGLQAGLNVTSADFSNVQRDITDESFTNFTNKLKPNFGAGVYYSNDVLFAGFSVPFILNNNVSSSAEALLNEISEARYYYLHGGLILPLNRMKTVQLNPTLLIRAQEGQPLSMDINAGFIFYDVCSIGLSYRNVEGIVSYIQLKLSDELNFGYSYDWTTSDINRYSSGTHEFSLNYRFRIRKIHGNVECPSVFKF
ncbi:PorP/SprF family type IX secretion system membrane protein [Fulvivirga ligni]|uniref:PorP/SprF family type IX secretion system membrane protein n=1 Tax=Fulvivirga ligni TaxID=2904246 RepID=UPI001F2F1A8B|nr:type IX secretion system membrane protein PorP/SprF [Fulvivirga ligni]UII19367.1 type IX secretion system membrane protein PorP/SprF [Fulvivirga ligni]